jgi:beta-galactosidase
VKNVTAEQPKPQMVKIISQAVLSAGNSDYSTEYLIYGSGDIVIESAFEPGSGQLPELPRFGMQMAIPNEFNTMTWYGRGPHESYWDRKTSADVGVYSGSVREQLTNYVWPQENGNKTDVRWVALTNKDDVGIMAIGMPLIYTSAWPYTIEDLEKAKHINELPQRETITVNLDYKQMGVGGDDGWTPKARAHPQYRLPAKNYSYTFRLRPYSEDLGKMGDIARQDFTLSE